MLQLRSLVAAVALLAVALLASTAQAAFPGTNGKIAFVSSRDGNFEIYAMNPDGSGQTRLTTNPATDFDPAWSPDGRRIAYVGFTDQGPDLPPLGIIWTVRYNGRDPQQVSDGELFAFRPDWSVGL